MNVPQVSYVVGKGTSSERGALGGGGSQAVVGIDHVGFPSAFASGFASSSALVHASVFFIVFDKAVDDVVLLCSDLFAIMRGEDQVRVLNSQDRLAQRRLVTVSNNLRIAMLAESRVARKRATASESTVQHLQSDLSAARRKIKRLHQENQAHEEARTRLAELEKQVVDLNE
ncbi:uncharacterized protein LOC113285558 [Papaver somniferum]|uniref:uncharacterized protein LOC113285558 n=1 Tax=Papaver somniferum TaxID=3469 RepID=UPI000E6FE68A|nr:uncharacterized protein LOC113285558 [Papaver somniferum]